MRILYRSAARISPTFRIAAALSFSLCATKVVGMGWNEHINRISTAEQGTGHDFAVSLE
jgi:hypothetical protein